MPESVALLQQGNYFHSLLSCGRLTLDRIQFDATQFDDHLFLRLGIECPPQIKRAVQKRKAEFFYGRLAARFAMERFGFSDNIPVNADRSPQWPEALCGAISHCRSEAVAVVLPAKMYAGAGVDIEQIVTGDTLSALKSMVVNAQELQRLQHYKTLYPEATLLTLIFSAKESFYKAAYPQVQRFFGFEALRFQLLTIDKQQMIFTIMQDLSPQLRQGMHVVIDFCLPEQDVVLTTLALTLIEEKFNC